MTKSQFLEQFYVKFDEVSTLASSPYTPQELSIIASEAQELLVTSYYDGFNPKREGFEETEKRIQDLGELVQNKEISPEVPSVDNMPNGRFYLLPNTLIADNTDYSDVYWFTVFEEAITNMKDTCITSPTYNTFKRVPIKEINHNEYSALLRDPFNRPNKDKVWRMRVDGRRTELITDGSYTVSKYHVRYIKKPAPIVLTTSLTSTVSELSDHVHRDLLNKTLELALKNTGNFNRFSIESQTNIS
jgi:hypothetical protein